MRSGSVYPPKKQALNLPMLMCGPTPSNMFPFRHSCSHLSMFFFDGKPLAFSPKNIYGFPVAVPLTQSWEPQMPGDTMGTLSAWSSSFLISLEELCERFSHLRRDPSVYYKSIWIIGKSCKIHFFSGFNSSTVQPKLFQFAKICWTPTAHEQNHPTSKAQPTCL